ncbi:hypothetical protein HAX54_012596, partial [Datura stramonium]|nr:hypothetical protein [Datura stramonium]
MVRRYSNCKLMKLIRKMRNEGYYTLYGGGITVHWSTRVVYMFKLEFVAKLKIYFHNKDKECLQRRQRKYSRRKSSKPQQPEEYIDIQSDEVFPNLPQGQRKYVEQVEWHGGPNSWSVGATRGIQHHSGSR